MKSIRKLFLVLPALLFAFVMIAATAPAEAQAAPASSDYYGKHHDYKYYSCDGTVHWVRKGESLSKIARKYSVTVYALADANGLKTDSHIYIHQKLCIPKAEGHPNGCAWTHKVRKGDTLSWIAKHYHVDYHALAAANYISDPDHIYAGMKLCIPQIYGTPVKHGGYHDGYHDGYHKDYHHSYDKGHDYGHGKHGGYYIVKKGDTLAKIAKWHGVSVHHLIKINNISDPDHIYYGMKLKIGY